MGCFYHGHYVNCLSNKKANSLTIGIGDKTYKELNDEINLKLSSLLSNNEDTVSVCHAQWECNFKEITKKTTEYKNFEDTYFPRPLHRLCPRNCVRGGLNETVALKWFKDEFVNETFYAIDINGLYAFCAVKNAFAVGKYDIVVGQDLEHITILNNKFYYKKQKVFGAIQLAILPPKNLNIPFLLYRTKNRKSLLTLCAKCAEQHNQKQCLHSDIERCLMSSYMINEIEYALNLGYKILKIFECHVYIRQKFIFKEFISLLNYYRMCNSNCLANFEDKKEQEAYCAKLTEKLNLPPNLQLKPDLIQYNPSNDTFYKLAMNSLFGKFQQKHEFKKSIFVSNQSQLEEEFLKHSKDIENIFCLNDSLCRIVIKQDENNSQPSRSTNCYIGSQLVSYARQEIHEKLMILENIKAQVFYFDTDSIFFSLGSNIPLPFEISHALGDFKHIVSGKIISFITLGPKNYALTFEDPKSLKIKEYIKCKGLSLKAHLTQKHFKFKIYDDFLKAYLSNRLSKIKLTHVKKAELCPFTFSNKISVHRKVLKTNCYLNSTPYGYNNEKY